MLIKAYILFLFLKKLHPWWQYVLYSNYKTTTYESLFFLIPKFSNRLSTSFLNMPKNNALFKEKKGIQSKQRQAEGKL